ncbi:hypothetical protein AB0I99_03975 [Streptomyces spongiicola]|uniref:HlyD family efflux transporter periplasmic adaptor subunit n=1 Tax=Streptomyces spongiicola TaxID=1690221 RepID=UPI00340B49F8
MTKVKTAPGKKVSVGQVLLEISGRPLFVLRGSVPAYRDLVPGKRGEDVVQLQAALLESGHPTGGDPSGVFGMGTQRALVTFYRSIGYEVPGLNAPMTEESNLAVNDSATVEQENDSVSVIPTFPMSEVIFVQSFPAHVDEVYVSVGDEAGASLLSLSSGALTVEGLVTPQEKGMIRPGQKVRIYSDTTGRQFTGKVSSVSKNKRPANDGGQESGVENYVVKVTPSEPLPVKLNGENVQLTVVAASSRGKVLAVPSSAISTGADGLTSVTERRGRTERRIPVTVGMTGDGFVQITPPKGTRLEAGAQVVVGVQPRSTVGRS